jgi:hypothetical protein
MSDATAGTETPTGNDAARSGNAESTAPEGQRQAAANDGAPPSRASEGAAGTSVDASSESKGKPGRPPLTAEQKEARERRQKDAKLQRDLKRAKTKEQRAEVLRRYAEDAGASPAQVAQPSEQAKPSEAEKPAEASAAVAAPAAPAKGPDDDTVEVVSWVALGILDAMICDNFGPGFAATPAEAARMVERAKPVVRKYLPEDANTPEGALVLTVALTYGGKWLRAQQGKKGATDAGAGGKVG